MDGNVGVLAPEELVVVVNALLKGTLVPYG